jgi:hypothetical protein
VLQGRRQSGAEDLLRNGDGGHRPGPAGVEREVDDDLLKLGLGQTVVLGPREVAPEHLLLFLMTVGVTVLGLLMVVMRALLRQVTTLRTDMEAVI